MELRERDLRTGIPSMDAEHQVAIGVLAELDQALGSGCGSGRVPSLLDLLATEVSAHFAAEEQQMLTLGYPMTSSHVAQHDRFLAELRQLRDAHAHAHDRDAVTARSVEHLRTWFVRHIEIADKPLATWLLDARTPSES